MAIPYREQEREYGAKALAGERSRSVRYMGVQYVGHPAWLNRELSRRDDLPPDFRWVESEDGDGPRVLAPLGLPSSLWKDIAACGKDNREGSVLITGETGTGKEELAKLLIRFCPERPQDEAAFVNCAGLDANLVVSELFGHRKGAFTGANRDRRGKLLEVNGGTIVLDELGEIPLHEQAKLLRFLQTGEVQPVGSDEKPRVVDVRVIAATNVDPADPHRIRQDLRNRFAFEIRLPPLRSDPEALVVLLGNRLDGDVFTGISVRWLLRLLWHEWPGNFRELDRYCRNAVSLTRRDNQRRARKREEWARERGAATPREIREKCRGIAVKTARRNARRMGEIFVLDEEAPQMLADPPWRREGSDAPPLVPEELASTMLALYEKEHEEALLARKHVDTPENVSTLKLLASLGSKGSSAFWHHPPAVPVQRLLRPEALPPVYGRGVSPLLAGKNESMRLFTALIRLADLLRDPKPLVEDEQRRVFGEHSRWTGPRTPSDAFLKWLKGEECGVLHYGEPNAPSKGRLEHFIDLLDDETDGYIVRLWNEGLKQKGIGEEIGARNGTKPVPKQTIHSRIERIREKAKSLKESGHGNYTDLIS